MIRAMTARVCLWSGPRNVSTALMYSFAQRLDTRVVDEPLYAHYLKVSGAAHPAREAVLAAQDPNGERVVSDVVLGPCAHPMVFFKQMAHHLVDLDWGFLRHTVNVLLVRDPAEMLPSLAVNVPQPRIRDTGLAVQTRLLAHLRALGQDPAVLDARLLLENPEAVLQRLCRWLDVPWEPAMLTWRAGPRPEDGVWAPHWYANVHRSTGFGQYKPRLEPLSPALLPLLAECRVHYDELLHAAEKFAAS
jgi:hypothetical protein